MSAISQSPQSWLDNLASWVELLGFSAPHWMSSEVSPGLARWAVTAIGLAIAAYGLWSMYQTKAAPDPNLPLRSTVHRIGEGAKAFPYQFLNPHFIAEVEKLRVSNLRFWISRPDAQAVRAYVLDSIDRNQQRMRIKGAGVDAESRFRIYELCIWLERALGGKREPVPERLVDPD